MPIAAASIAAGASIFGSLISGNAAADASRRQAEALREDARNRMFSPVGTTNRFGTSNAQIDPATGKVIGAGYALSPELKAFQDRFMGLAGSGLTQIENAPGMYAPLTGAARSMYDLGRSTLLNPPRKLPQST